MAERGGYRRPSNPAPVSGPGSLSRRTDGGPGQPVRVAPGGEYGERKESEQIQSAAPMAEESAPPAPRPPGLREPSARPDEPITAGAPLGPGVGPAAAGIMSDSEITNEQLRPLVRSLEIIANLPGSNPETRTYVRLLKARLAE